MAGKCPNCGQFVNIQNNGMCPRCGAQLSASSSGHHVGIIDWILLFIHLGVCVGIGRNGSITMAIVTFFAVPLLLGFILGGNLIDKAFEKLGVAVTILIGIALLIVYGALGLYGFGII